MMCIKAQLGTFLVKFSDRLVGEPRCSGVTRVSKWSQNGRLLSRGTLFVGRGDLNFFITCLFFKYNMHYNTIYTTFTNNYNVCYNTNYLKGVYQ